MMTIPEVGMYNDIAIFPDDENVNYYYCVRNTPLLRMQDGVPVFYGTFWTKNTAKTAAEVVELGGGIVNFDINLGITAAEKEAIIKMIDSGIRDNQIASLNALKQSAKLHEKDTTEHFKYNFVLDKKAIELRPVDYRGGSVTLLEKEGTSLVESVSSGSSSLFGDNSASLALTLTPLGGEIWYRCLMGGQKAIGIRYDLTCQVRLPSLSVHIHAASFKDESWEGKAAVEKTTYKLGFFSVGKTKQVDPGDLTRKLIDNGLITIDIDRKLNNLPEDYVTEVWNSMFEVVKKKIESIILDRYTGVPEDECKSLMEKYLLEDLNAMTDMYLNQKDAFEIKLHPQCTLYNFLKDIPESAKKQAVNLVDLRNPVLLPHRSVKFRVTMPEYVSYVNVVAKCGDEQKSFNFTDKEPEQTWVMNMKADSTKEIEYTTNVRFINTTDDDLVHLGKKTSSGDVFLDIGRIGLIDLLFKPHPDLVHLEGKNEVSSIALFITYPNGKGKQEKVETILNPKSTEGIQFHQLVQGVIDKPVLFQARYDFAAGGRDSIWTEEKKVYLNSGGDNLPVYPPCPFKSSMTIACTLPVLDEDSDAKTVKVEFRYEDPDSDDFIYTASCEFSKDADWEDVSVRLYQVNPALDTFKYRFLVKGAKLYQSPWLTGEGDGGTLIIPLQRIMVDYSLLHMGTDFHMGSLTLGSTDGSIPPVSFSLTEKCTGEKPLEFYGTVDDTREYTYKLDNLWDMEGNRHEPMSGTWTGPLFMLPKPQ